MTLPSNPRAPGARGLPSNPRPRSRSAMQSSSNAQNELPTNSHESPSPPRPTRQLRSVSPARPRERSRSRPPLPKEPRLAPMYRGGTYSDGPRPEPGLSHKSYDSASSSGSSFLDRMKVGVDNSSSPTSFEDEYQTFPPKGRAMRPGGPVISLRQKRLARDTAEDVGQTYTSSFGLGDGSAMWSRVATVASTLSVSVSKAWAVNVATSASEKTPPGQESRLTRAMKSYHLEKARDPTDLPSWLFDEPTRQRTTNLSHNSDNHDVFNTSTVKRPVTAKPVHDSAPSVPYIPAATSTRATHNRNTETPFPSKATDRLKAMREAKRGASTTPRRPFTDTTGHNTDPDKRL